MTASYDYDSKGFRLINSSPVDENIKKLEIHVRSQGVEHADHPLLRQSLYFHELKNIEQIVKINYPKNSPSNFGAKKDLLERCIKRMPKSNF